MTRKEFIKVLKEQGYYFEIVEDKIMVTHGAVETLSNGVVFNNGDDVYLESLETLPSGVEFRNRGDVSLESLKTIPSGVVFKNGERVLLRSLVTLPPGVEFKNRGNVYLGALKTIPPGVEFGNGGSVYLESLIGVWIEDWKGNIKGIDSTRLLNKMIEIGLLDRR